MFFFNNIHHEIHRELCWGIDLFRRMGYAFCISFIVAGIIAPIVIKYLKNRKMEQVFRDQNEVHILAQLHSPKAHTPTMGGIIILIAMLCGTIRVVHWNFQVILTLISYLALAITGFVDDFAKIRAHNTRGISGRKKLLIQLILTIAIALALRHNSDYAQYCALPIPFSSSIWTISSGLLFLIFLFFVLSGTSNAVNLTDGLDGLVTKCAIPVLFFFGIVAIITGNERASAWCDCTHIPGNEELAILCASMLGGLSVFLWYNAYPASIFMGDMGSLSLGMFIGIIAFLTNHPFHLVIAGGIFVMEALSDMLQVFSFKCFNKRRIFKMAPIHHHFELSGMHEAKITQRFAMVSYFLSIMAMVGLFHFFIK
ncbi:MAG: phospho-N-acetylmuramoyl-pentapeptide-transferase [Puniceicoccales bacterium]|jgi:phospho-N-acetylmuramoyl-pentapeptide-transferase|nr:phospho-N-acetylmuramoyl-pentapeptide-transferase [Puniceicoccales bacterium]